MIDIDDQVVPEQLRSLVREFWPFEEWNHAVSVAELESGFNQWALNDTTNQGRVPCGTVLEIRDGVKITAERSCSWFAINSCNYPETPWYAWFDARSNVGEAHALWVSRGWEPWYFSAKQLGLL